MSPCSWFLRETPFRAERPIRVKNVNNDSSHSDLQLCGSSGSKDAREARSYTQIHTWGAVVKVGQCLMKLLQVAISPNVCNISLQLVLTCSDLQHVYMEILYIATGLYLVKSGLSLKGQWRPSHLSHELCWSTASVWGPEVSRVFRESWAAPVGGQSMMCVLCIQGSALQTSPTTPPFPHCNKVKKRIQK